ncbi:unnamed protein product [Macrosiphum euphorbiae]|uniref:Uncharacterized protein n=1 Tax=Macrosiphum euphorbiae TaxID=13131 RepID=A0AAV0VLN5_9HEMI|nr:unnamed protein product [Macrosiphum euphorbiae]
MMAILKPRPRNWEKGCGKSSIRIKRKCLARRRPRRSQRMKKNRLSLEMRIRWRMGGCPHSLQRLSYCPLSLNKGKCLRGACGANCTGMTINSGAR